MMIAEDIKRYIELAELCKMTYESAINQYHLRYEKSKLIKQKIVHGSVERGYCRLFWNDDTVIIAFRGTREDIDWKISNLKILPIKLRDCGKQSESIRVHQGFHNTLNFIDKTTQKRSLDAIIAHIQQNHLFNGRKIVITGHSLGGALAILFAVKLRYYNSDYFNRHISEIVTFGSPAVGFKGFQNFYQELDDKTIRIVNNSDIVPFTPPLFYRHIGKQIWLRESSSFLENSNWLKRLIYALRMPRKNMIDDHSMERYISMLQVLV
jgi:predicted lipase